jgi:penicillin-binding protein 1A
MNQMMQAVVQEGTGRRAQLEFTHSVGKTGTSSSYRDAWFLGFTGSLVTGVWIGNDDFRAMYIRPESRTGNASGVTGGGLPAQTWQNFMAVAHQTMNIPTIPGLAPHPRQVQEAQKLAELKISNPALAAAQLQAQAGNRQNKIMPDQTRDLLRRLAEAMRRAGGTEAPGEASRPAPGSLPSGSPVAPTEPRRQTGPATPQPQPGERRADAQGPVVARP